MWDEAELSDDDLRSVYGVDALRVRIRTSIEDLERKYLETARQIALLQPRADAARQALGLTNRPEEPC